LNFFFNFFFLINFSDFFVLYIFAQIIHLFVRLFHFVDQK
jgi:hypothetical protein